MVHEGLKKVLNGIVAAAQAAGRAPGDVTLIAVSKTFDGPEIIPVIEAGQRVFGENRVQEAKAKWPALKMAWLDVELHLIGPLQSNKAAEAVPVYQSSLLAAPDSEPAQRMRISVVARSCRLVCSKPCATPHLLSCHRLPSETGPSCSCCWTRSRA